MRLRRTRATGSFTALLSDLFGTRQRRKPRRLSGLAGAERFEERKLLALTVTSIGTPTVGAENVDLATDLVFTFNENVLKGQGNIYVVEQDAGQVGIAVDVRSSAVTIAGNQVSVDLPADLLPDNTYSVYIDAGAFIDTSTTPTAGATLLTQNFEFAALGPFINETGGDGTDFSTTPQFGFDFQTTLDPTRGIDEWRGWSFADKDSWIAADNQGRDQFVLGSGTVMVADTDEYDDGNAAERPFVGYSYTPGIDLTGVAANSVKLEFDSSFRPEGPGDSQIGTLEVTFDGGTTWTELLRLDEFNTSNVGTNTASRNINERLVSGTTTGVSTDGKGGASFGAVTNPSSGSMQFRFWVTGTNDWWWAIDNMKISGDIVGVPFAGLSDANAWTFSTPESPKFTLAIDSSAISENGGTATATLSRNAGPLVPDGEIVVTLTSSDESELTVPATVMIPAGQTSVTFPITAVDDALADRVQLVTITASLDPFRSATAELAVLDDEGPKVVSVNPGYDATGANYQSDLSVTFDRAVKKGAGIIRVVRTATGVQVAEVDVADSSVVVSGTTMTVELPDLPGLTEFSVLIDDGVVVSTSTDLFPFVVLMQENFDALPLLSFADSLVGPDEGDGTDYTFQNPIGFSVDNSQMPVPAGSSPFEGWSYMDKNSWIDEQNDQSRARFTLGSGVVAVADGDAWTDYPRAENSYMTTFLVTRPVDLTGITAGSVALQFDSSFYHELPQFGTVEVTYDGGLSWSPLLFFGDTNVPGINDGSSRNERISIDSTNVLNDIVGSGIVDSSLFNPDFGTLQFRFGYQNAGNNWWWAVDNIVIRGERAGEPFAGLVGDAWSFTTSEAPTLSVSFDTAIISEQGTTMATVSRNLNLAQALTVSLVSSDLTAATVPATITIPAGQASVTFTVTAVDDSVTDGDQVAVITASAAGFFAGEAALTVSDDDFPQLLSATPAPGSAGAAVDGPLTLVFDQAMQKGNGFISIVDAATGKAVESISVLSSSVIVVGDRVTVTRSERLLGLTQYAVRIDPGAVLAATPGVSENVTLLWQDFELLPLGPAVDEDPAKGDGTDWTATPPADWVVDNSAMPVGGKAEYSGWTFLDKDVWQAWSGQSRNNFTLASGTIAVADTDEWDDKSHDPGDFNGILRTPVIDLSTVTSSAVTIEFDSSFRPESGGGGAAEGNQTGVVEVTFDDGATWTNLLTQDGNTSTGSATDPSVNRHEVLTATIPAGATAMQVRFGQIGSNDYWWAIDNLRISGTVESTAFPGILDAQTFAFTTEDAAAQPVLESFSVVGGAANADVSAPISLAFNQPMRAGNGFIHLVEAASGKALESFNVVTDVVFSGNSAVITPSAQLAYETGYFVKIDQGALLTTALESRAGVPVLLQDFELLPLGPAVDEDPAKGDGTDWTATPPADWVVDNSAMPVGGKAEYSGWTFLDKDVWQAWSGQSRNNFTLASGTIAVADTDEWDDKSHDPGDFNGILRTPVIDLSTVTSSAVTIEFDSSFRPESGGGGAAEGNQTGVVEVTFDDGATWTNLLTQDGNTSTGSATDPSVNRHEVLTATIPAGATAMQVRFGQIGSNDYWWAIDNLRFTADVDRWAFEGVSESTTVAFTTMAAPNNDTVVEVGVGQTVTDTVVHAGDETIVKTGAGTLVIDLANTHTGGLRVEAGTVILRNVGALNGGPLTVAAGARVVVDTGTSRINLSDLALDPAGSLELGRAGVVVASGGFEAAAVRQALIAGRNGGAWTGPTGITSATAATTAGRAVGYAVGNDGRLTVGFAALGDANMDGQFNPFDLVALQSGGVFNTGAASSWQTGDFNYDGVSNVVDLVGANGSGVYGQGNYNVAPAEVQVVSASVTVTGSVAAAPAPSLSSSAVTQLTFAALSAEQDRASSTNLKKRAFATL